jgi:hypothetical protein
MAGVDQGPETGDVHRAVTRAINAAIKDGSTDRALDAGAHAAAKSLAAAIDRASGLGGRKQETYALAAMHKELRDQLRAIRGQGTASDELRELLEGIGTPQPFEHHEGDAPAQLPA